MKADGACIGTSCAELKEYISSQGGGEVLSARIEAPTRSEHAF